MTLNKHLSDFAGELISEGARVMTTKYVELGIPRPGLVDLEAFQAWRSSCRVLCASLGSWGKVWSPVFEGHDQEPPTHYLAKMIQGALKSVKETVEKGRLVRVEDLASAEIFSDLVEQAEYLLEKKYFLAAGVILRAVLEERLRKLCSNNDCVPEKARPTIEDFNQALYKANHYDKTVMKQVGYLADIGNRAAHGDPALPLADVEKLKSGLNELLARLSV